AEPVDNVLDRPCRDILFWLNRFVDKCAALNFMGEEPLLFQSSKDGARSRVLHGPSVGQRLAACFSSSRTLGPAILHHQFFQLPQALWLSFLCAIHRNVTDCNMSARSGQAKKMHRQSLSK